MQTRIRVNPYGTVAGVAYTVGMLTSYATAQGQGANLAPAHVAQGVTGANRGKATQMGKQNRNQAPATTQATQTATMEVQPTQDQVHQAIATVAAQAGLQPTQDAIGALAATLAANPTSTTPAVAPLPTVVSVAGQHVTAARNVVARAATLGNLPAALVAVQLQANPAKPCKVRVPYTVQCWQAMQAVLTANGGTATGAMLAQASTGDMVRYAVARKWLVPVQPVQG